MKKILKALLIALFIIFSPLTIVFGKQVILGGDNIGIELDFEGILISGTYDIKYNNITYNPVDSDIKKGDYIISINSNKVETSKDLIQYINKLDKTQEVSLTILRNNKQINRNLLVINNNGNWKTGLMIKDHILGIGTVTYYDSNHNTYAALGHEISDSSSGQVIKIEGGTIYSSNVTGVTKSINGKPGEKIATIDKENELGSIIKNTKYGIYGETEVIPDDGIYIETASIDEVQLGKAEIWTVLKGNIKKKYDIEITNIKKQDKKDIKGITFKIVDKELLNNTNGVIQGMSGSPIVQNGKLIGAITHVIVSDVTTGYGIHINWMIETEESLV
ncbi:MAG: PDZ domain-containing protein [Bacilli bacterium]|nr:PDZ domain-containing protein [Bacilli bacterium]